MTNINMIDDDDFDILEVDFDTRPDLEDVCDNIVEWWMEDYTFEELLEEFDVTPNEAFYALVTLGFIDEDDLVAYLTSDR